jgi:hypothetical protein
LKSSFGVGILLDARERAVAELISDIVKRPNPATSKVVHQIFTIVWRWRAKSSMRICWEYQGWSSNLLLRGFGGLHQTRDSDLWTGCTRLIFQKIKARLFY